MGVTATPATSSNYRRGSPRRRAVDRAPAPAFRAAGYRPPEWRYRLGLRAIPESTGPARSREAGPPGQRSGRLNDRFNLVGTFVEEHQVDCPRCGLGLQISKALTAGRDRGCVLAPFESVARPPPGKPLWRSWCASHRGEIAGPPRRAISAHRRGSVQPPSWRVSSSRIAAAIAPACGPILACCPGLWRRRSPATPPCAK